MTLPRKSANRYDINHSALYRLPSARALAIALQWDKSPSALRALSKRKDNFEEFERINRDTGKRRKIQAPSTEAKPLQKRLNTLLKQIRVPAYLQSGVPGRSHLSNSLLHLQEDGATVTVDVSAFYESISRKRLFRLFRNVFQCEPDVADILADLVCCNGHLATGSPASVLLSFFACKDMFDLVAERALSQGAKFTLYVDDMALTGNTIGHGDIRFLEASLRKFGFRSKKEKSKLFRKRQAKIVTGRAFRDGVSRAPNSKHKELRDTLEEIKTTKPSIKKMRSAVGRLENVGLLDEVRGQQLKDRAKRIRVGLPPVRHRRKYRSNAKVGALRTNQQREVRNIDES